MSVSAPGPPSSSNTLLPQSSQACTRCSESASQVSARDGRASPEHVFIGPSDSVSFMLPPARQVRPCHVWQRIAVRRLSLGNFQCLFEVEARLRARLATHVDDRSPRIIRRPQGPADGALVARSSSVADAVLPSASAPASDLGLPSAGDALAASPPGTAATSAPGPRSTPLALLDHPAAGSHDAKRRAATGLFESGNAQAEPRSWFRLFAGSAPAAAPAPAAGARTSIGSAAAASTTVGTNNDAADLCDLTDGIMQRRVGAHRLQNPTVSLNEDDAAFLRGRSTAAGIAAATPAAAAAAARDASGSAHQRSDSINGQTFRPGDRRTL